MEFKHFTSDDNFEVNELNCDTIFNKPTFVIKLDASVNMYHHFCDFLNLFASQFLNNTYFGQDVNIFWWDTVCFLKYFLLNKFLKKEIFLLLFFSILVDI